MDLSFLIPSKTRRTVLNYFVRNPETQMGVRELAREIGLSPQLVYRELTNLESWGFLFSSKVGMFRSFRRNKKFVFNDMIDKIFKKYDELRTRKTEVAQVYDWKKLQKEYRKIPIPPEWVAGLQSKRKRPRSYDEEKSLRSKGML